MKKWIKKLKHWRLAGFMFWLALSPQPISGEIKSFLILLNNIFYVEQHIPNKSFLSQFHYKAKLVLQADNEN